MSDKKFIPLLENYVTSDLVGLVKVSGSLGGTTSASLAKLIDMIGENKISSRGAKDTLVIMHAEGGDPEAIAKKHGLIQIHDTDALRAAVNIVLAREKKAILEYKNGKQAALQYLIGKAMKESGGAGNPEILHKIIVDKLK